MHARHAVLQHPRPAAPVLHHRLRLPGEHRRHERVGQHRRHPVAGAQRRLGHPDAQVPRADQQALVGLQDVRLVRQVGQPGPAGAERLQHRRPLPARPLDRRHRPPLARRSAASTPGGPGRRRPAARTRAGMKRRATARRDPPTNCRIPVRGQPAARPRARRGSGAQTVRRAADTRLEQHRQHPAGGPPGPRPTRAHHHTRSERWAYSPAPTTRVQRPRAGRVLPGQADRPQGDHRHLLHRARARARRHPVLPVRQRGGRPRRRARPLPGHGLQERPRRAGPRRRQGGDLGRPRPDQERGAAARVRPLRGVPRRALLHRLRRRHLRRRHGRGRPRDPLRHRPQRSTAAPATPRSSPPGACSRACGPRPSTSGAPRPWPAAGSASPASARSASTSPAT